MKNINKFSLIFLTTIIIVCGDLHAAERLLFQIEQGPEDCPKIRANSQADLMLIWFFDEKKRSWQLAAYDFDGTKLWEKDRFSPFPGNFTDISPDGHQWAYKIEKSTPIPGEGVEHYSDSTAGAIVDPRSGIVFVASDELFGLGEIRFSKPYGRYIISRGICDSEEGANEVYNCRGGALTTLDGKRIEYKKGIPKSDGETSENAGLMIYAPDERQEFNKSLNDYIKLAEKNGKYCVLSEPFENVSPDGNRFIVIEGRPPEGRDCHPMGWDEAEHLLDAETYLVWWSEVDKKTISKFKISSVANVPASQYRVFYGFVATAEGPRIAEVNSEFKTLTLIDMNGKRIKENFFDAPGMNFWMRPQIVVANGTALLVVRANKSVAKTLYYVFDFDGKLVQRIPSDPAKASGSMSPYPYIYFTDDGYVLAVCRKETKKNASVLEVYKGSFGEN